MPAVTDRIVGGALCPVIVLTEAEKDIYRGAGWRLARFECGALVELFNVADVEWQADIQAMADAAVNVAQTWLSGVSGEVWLVRCSSYELCEPQRVLLSDPLSIARLTRVIGEIVSDER